MFGQVEGKTNLNNLPSPSWRSSGPRQYRCQTRGRGCACARLYRSIKGDYLSSKLGTATGNKLIITGTLKFEEQYTVRFINKFNHIRQLHTITRPVFFSQLGQEFKIRVAKPALFGRFDFGAPPPPPHIGISSSSYGYWSKYCSKI